MVVGVDRRGPARRDGHQRRPTAYDIVLIGGLWTAQVLALRAAATGARVAVETGRAQQWSQLDAGGRRRTVGDDRARRGPGAAAGRVGGRSGARHPGLRHAAAARPGRLGALAVRADAAAVSEPGRAAADARQARLVGVQRVSPDEASEIGRVIGLPRGEYESLPTLADGVTLWCTDRDRRYVMTQGDDGRRDRIVGNGTPDGLTDGARRPLGARGRTPANCSANHRRCTGNSGIVGRRPLRARHVLVYVPGSCRVRSGPRDAVDSGDGWTGLPCTRFS